MTYLEYLEQQLNESSFQDQSWLFFSSTNISLTVHTSQIHIIKGASFCFSPTKNDLNAENR